ncbi:DUF4827 domain-containing protein [Bacteroides faecalis]|nr:DUF4827 domain-containing protein [Bacteroides faecalis]
MKKLVYLFLSLMAAGGLFQACDNSKTYAEQLEDEKREVSRFIRDNGIHIISQDEFERNDTVTNLDRNEYVALSDGVYMQIVDRGSEENKTDTFATNDEICVRYIERSIMGDSIQSLNVFYPGYENPLIYSSPLVFRYNVQGSYAYGTVVEMDYSWMLMVRSQLRDYTVPAGWLLALPFVRNNAHVRLIVPSKMGHAALQSSNYVIPYHYDIWSFSKALN